MMPTNLFQRFGDWWEQREEYRKQALAALRRREGLPVSTHLRGVFYQRADGFYPEPPGREIFLDTTLYPNGQGGYTQWATGKRKGMDRKEADQHWGRAGRFEILEVAEDGRKLTDELRDLSRDAAGMELAEKVSHGPASEQAPDLELDGTGDEEVESKLKAFWNRGK
jgi:hypothetical protein